MATKNQQATREAQGTYLNAPTQRVRAENGIDYAYRDCRRE